MAGNDITTSWLRLFGPGGHPALGGHWGAADPANPKRTATLFHSGERSGRRHDIGADRHPRPDIRKQLLDAGGPAGWTRLLYTHSLPTTSRRWTICG